jgi:ankyrin repeat protein
MTSAGLRRFEPPQTDENGVTTLSYEYLDSLYICSAAWSQPPLDTNWAGGPLTLAKIKTERTTLQVNGVDSVGNSTLDEQLRERRPDIVDELVRAGADVNGANRYGYTSLMTAVVYDQDGTTMVQRLLDAGADVDVQDKSGTTALMVATRYNRKEAAALLLARGADPTIRDNQGRTAAAMTRDWDPTLNTVLEEAAKRRR